MTDISPLLTFQRTLMYIYIDMCVKYTFESLWKQNTYLQRQQLFDLRHLQIPVEIQVTGVNIKSYRFVGMF